LSSPPKEKKALAIMKSLDDAVTAEGGSGDQLTQIYMGLGMSLQKQAAQLREAGREQDAARLTAAFAQFVDRIATRQADAKWPARAWLAQTYYSMGTADHAGPSAANLAGPPKRTEAERAYLLKARDAYQALIAEAVKDPKFPPSEISVLAARVALGECLRALGEYQPALDMFSAVLKDREKSLDVQRAAAQTYQERGLAEDARWLENAIHGGYKLKSTGENRIWGWRKISDVAARAARTNEKYRDTFFEARYNMARCRYLVAMKSKGDKRTRDLAKAKQSIQSLAQVYPDLGGERWHNEFDAMLKEIQLASKEKPTGLGEFSNDKTATKAAPPG
jgi:tetratricopeptide (TPR) repeat protein